MLRRRPDGLKTERSASERICRPRSSTHRLRLRNQRRRGCRRDGWRRHRLRSGARSERKDRQPGGRSNQEGSTFHYRVRVILATLLPAPGPLTLGPCSRAAALGPLLPALEPLLPGLPPRASAPGPLTSSLPPRRVCAADMTQNYPSDRAGARRLSTAAAPAPRGQRLGADVTRRRGTAHVIRRSSPWQPTLAVAPAGYNQRIVNARTRRPRAGGTASVRTRAFRACRRSPLAGRPMAMLKPAWRAAIRAARRRRRS